MRTLLVVGLVVGPVVVLGAPLALASGVTLPPGWTASAAFVLAAVAAVGGLLLLALSFRPRRAAVAATVEPVERVEPVEQPGPAASPLVVVHNARPGRYVPAPVVPLDNPDPVTEPASRERIVTLRPRRRPQSAQPGQPRRATVGAR